MKNLFVTLLLFSGLAQAGAVRDIPTGIVTFSETTTPSTPGSGKDRVYMKSDGLLYKLNSSGAEQTVGSDASANRATNSGFESGTTGWTASGGTFTATSTAANVGSQSKAGSWDSGSSAQTLTNTALTVTSAAGLSGQNGVASCRVKCDSGTCTHTIQAYDGSNILASSTITSTTTGFARASVNFIFPASGTTALRLVSVASDEPTLYIDDCYIGLAEGYNISQIAQAQYVGSAYFATTASCTGWTRTNTALGAFSTDTDCPGPTVENGGTGPWTWQTTDTDLPKWTINNLPAGEYEAYVTVPASNSGGVANSFALNDGTTTSGRGYSTGTASVLSQVTIVAHFSYSTSGNRTFEVYGASASGSVDIGNEANNKITRLTLLRFPTAPEQAFKPEERNWRVDATITAGGFVSIGTSTQASYVGIENSGLTLTNNSGNGVLTAQIPCSSTNAPTGTTCAAGNESVGVSFVLPKAGDVLACASFSYAADTGAGGFYDTTFQVIETPNAAQTLTQEGKGRVQTSNKVASTSMITPLRVCGTFTFTSAGQKTLRLMFEMLVGATVSNAGLWMDAGASNGQRDVHWEVYPINQGVPAPVLVGSVTSNSTGAERIERAKLNCDASSSITSQSGTWLTAIGNRSTAACAITIATGIFSATPTCTLTVEAATVQATSVVMSSATAGTVYGASSDYDANLICMGAK